MCIIISFPPKKTIKPVWIINSLQNHPDGTGFMYSYNSTLYVVKREDNEKVPEILEELISYRTKYINSHFVFFSRAASYGNVSLENTHPIFVNEQVAIVHNGSFNIDRNNRSQSDTAALAKLLSGFTTEQLKSEPVKGLIELACREAGSLVVMMFNDGTVNIFNDDNGIEEKGIWFSNSSYKKLFQIVRIRLDKQYLSEENDRTICLVCKNRLNLKEENMLCNVCSSKFIHTFNSKGKNQKESETSV